MVANRLARSQTMTLPAKDLLMRGGAEGRWLSGMSVITLMA